MSGRKFYLSSILIIILALCGALLLSEKVFSEDRIIHINITIPSNCGNSIVETGEQCDIGAGNGVCPATCSASCTSNSCGGEPPGVDGLPPEISNISSVAGSTTATVSWVAVDNVAVTACTFSYGTTPALGSAAVPANFGNNYQAVLSGLTDSTFYYFQILCQDSSNNSASATGTFLTGGVIVHSLTVQAVPEKRVPRPGGNLDLSATLIIYNPASQNVLYTMPVELNYLGQTTMFNVPLPSGNNLEAFLKGNGHLAKKIIGVDISAGIDLTMDFTDAGHFSLLAGDLAGDIHSNPGAQGPFVELLSSLHRDDFVDILDISAAVARFNEGRTNLANLNGDDIVDSQDISMILSNWNRQGAVVSQ